jgi:Zn-dependent protease with chaperone function
MVTAIVAAIALLPLAVPVLWGVFHEPGEHTWTVVILGTFLNLVVCNQYLQPPIQLVGQKSLPLVEDPAILSRLAKLAAAIGVPAPPLRLWPSISDNQPTLAFAGTVSAPQLVITDGALNRLAEEESDAILAHELAHLANHSLWFHLPTLSAAAILAGQVSGAGGFPAAGLGWLCLVGFQRLVSRPLEFDSDRRAALVVTPQSMMRALEKIHLVHRIEGNEWLKRLCYVMATHPSPSSRIARLKQQACVELSRAESSELSRGRWLGWMVFGAWLGAIVGGLALIRSWRVAAIPVGVMWIALSLLPQHLERLATRKIRRLNARRMASRKIHWSTWLFWSLWFASLGGLVLPQFLSSDHSDFSWISISALCLQVVLAGILLMRMTRRSRLQHNILTASTLGNHEHVVREFDNAPRWFQRDPTMDNLTAVALALTSRRAEAIHRLEQLHAREPRFPAALMTLIALDYDEGNDTRAEALAARLTGLLPEDPIGPFRQILSLVRMGRLDEARTVLEAARGRISTAELLDLAEAALAIHGTQPERARELLETCDSRLPGDCLVATLWVEWHLRQVSAADTATKAHAAFERLETLVRSNRLAMLDKTVERLREQIPVDNRHPNEASQPEVEWTSET